MVFRRHLCLRCASASPGDASLSCEEPPNSAALLLGPPPSPVLAAVSEPKTEVVNPLTGLRPPLEAMPAHPERCHQAEPPQPLETVHSRPVRDAQLLGDILKDDVLGALGAPGKQGKHA
jgi:hypothetical protein